jgi:hypothetical protein
LLDTLDHVPAFIVGRRTEVLASNQLARAVLADFGARPGAGCNFARFVLAEPVARELFVDWETAARDAVAILRMEAGRRPTDRQLADLVGELREQCPEFAAWWDDRGVLNRTHGVKLLHNPTVGDLTFSYEVFPAPADPDRSLCIYSVEPGSPSEQALRLLASWAATPQHDTSAVES